MHRRSQGIETDAVLGGAFRRLQQIREEPVPAQGELVARHRRRRRLLHAAEAFGAVALRLVLLLRQPSRHRRNCRPETSLLLPFSASFSFTFPPLSATVPTCASLSLARLLYSTPAGLRKKVYARGAQDMSDLKRKRA